MTQDSLPAWIQPGLAARTALRDRIARRAESPVLPTVQQTLMFEWATNADKMFFTEYNERVCAAMRCEERMPFFDRRLVEWALGLDEGQRWRDGVGKVVLRHAARPHLPSAIVNRTHAPDFSFITVEGLQQIGGRDLLRSIARRRAEWVSGVAIDAVWDQMLEAAKPGGVRLGHYSWILWLLVATHLAVEAIERTPAHTMDHAQPDLQEMLT